VKQLLQIVEMYAKALSEGLSGKAAIAITNGLILVTNNTADFNFLKA